MNTVLITGGSAGIGQATALEVARQGLGVVLTYRGHETEARETVARIEAEGGSASALYLDVGDVSCFAAFETQLVASLRETCGAEGLHALVNNAGIGGGGPFGDVTEEMFDNFHRTLFKGPYFLTQRLLPLLHDGAAIVNTGSSSALATGIEVGYSSYAAQKGAVHVVTQYWAKELAARGIRVNAVAPGSTRTRIADDVFTRIPEAAASVGATIPLGRIGEAEDIARVIAFLISPAAGWITGQIVECSGGQGL